MNRRKLLQGAGALLVAPALDRASSIMPVRDHGPIRYGIPPEKFQWTVITVRDGAQHSTVRIPFFEIEYQPVRSS